jgi:hypothetical protein
VHRLILIAISIVLIVAAQAILIGPTPTPSEMTAGAVGWDIGFSAALVVAWMLPVYAALNGVRWLIMRTKAD